MVEKMPENEIIKTGEKKNEALEEDNRSLKEVNPEMLKWKAAFENAPIPMAIHDVLTGKCRLNFAFSQSLGRDIEKGEVPWNSIFQDDETADIVLDALIGGQFWTGEVELAGLKNEGVTVQLNAHPIETDTGDVFSIIAFRKNFLESKLLKKQKELHAQYLQTLQAVTLGMIRRLKINDLLSVILQKACLLSQVSSGFIFLYNPENKKLVLEAASGRYREYKGNRIEVDDGIIGNAFQKKEPAIFDNLKATVSDSEFEMFANEMSLIVVPIISGAKLHGVIGLSDPEKEIDHDTIHILEEFSSITTITIDNADLHKSVKDEFNKRLEIERISKEKERQAKELVEKQNADLKAAYIESIHRLVLASEFKDEDTGEHIVRIGEYSRLMAQKLGWPENRVEEIKYAAPMHDVGKIGIPDKVINKPGKLNEEEFNLIKTHTEIGAKLLSDSSSSILMMAREIALNHHEKFNGRGYPNGLSGDQIPMSARIVALVDTFDALTSRRPYKDPYPPEMALDIIRNESGEHFDPELVGIFIDHFEAFMKIREDIGGLESIDLENFMLSDRDINKTVI